MKYRWIICSFLVTVILSGCSNDKKLAQPSNSDRTASQIAKDSMIPTAKITSGNRESIPDHQLGSQPLYFQLKITKDFLTHAAKGILDGVDIGLGATKDDLIHKWGEPEYKGKDNAEFFTYGGCNYYFWDVGQVGAMKLSLDQQDITPDFVKDALGQPKSEGPDDETNGYLLYYTAGTNELFFNSPNKQSDITYLTFKKQG